MNRQQRGFTLHEIIGALAIGSMMLVGLTAMINSTLADTRAQQAALHHSRVAEAATKYVTDHYSTLLTAAPPAGTNGVAPGVITLATLRTGGYLANSFADTNPYGQTHCVLLRQPAPNQIDALIITQGGNQIPRADLAYVATNAGRGAGYISYDTPTAASGVFGSWTQPLTAATHDAVGCSATAGTPAGHLATAYFYNGPGQLPADFLYRNRVNGRDELNQMTTPVQMLYQAPINQSDSLCVAGDPSTYGRIAVDANNTIMSCQLGVWRLHGAGTWRGTVASHAALPTTDNLVGDVRIATGGTSANRAFTWNGTSWIALAVDQNGNLNVPETLTAKNATLTERLTTNDVSLERVVVVNTACDRNGLIARDASGSLLSCKSGTWRDFSQLNVTQIYSRQFEYTGLEGSTMTASLDLNNPATFGVATLPARPYFVTGFSHCYAKGPNTNSTDALSYVSVEIRDALGTVLGYAGGCGTSVNNATGITTKGFLDLTQLPANAATLRVKVNPGTGTDNWADVRVIILRGE